MDGIIIINKPVEITSRQVVSKVGKILNEKKAGHTGTLDPMASGVLPVLLGKATKLSKYLVEHDKKYIATLYLGEKRDTGDSEGNIIEKKDIPNLYNDIIEVELKKFLGKTQQIPPMYSAIKVKGKKLYEYAREGVEIERAPRDIEIYDIKLLDYNENKIKFEVFCSKGTYIRVLCEDIAEKLGTVGFMQNLERIQVDKFKIEDSVKLDELSEDYDNIITIERYFNYLEKIVLNNRKLELFLNGVKLTFELEDGIYNIYNSNNEYIGIGIVENNLLKRDIIL